MLWGSGAGIVAVDIGSSAVKLVAMRGGTVVAAGLREVAARLGEGLSPRDATLAAIRDLLAELRVTSRRAVGIVQGPSTATLRLTLPRMPSKELQQAVRWEAQKVLPFPLDGAILAHQVVGEAVGRDGVAKLAVLVGAVAGERAAEAVEILRAAGLEPVGLTVVPAALAGLIRHGGAGGTPNQVWALMDLGAQASHLIFFSGTKLQLAREIGVGGRAITEAMTAAVMVQGHRVQLDAGRAEHLKRELGIPSAEATGQPADGIPLLQLGIMMRTALDRLVVEIQRSFAYYQEQVGGTPVSRLRLSGGTAQLRDLSPFLSERLGIDVEILESAARIDLAKRLSRKKFAGVAPRFAVAAGLALDRGRSLDLLPPHLAANRRAIRARLGMRAAVVTATLAVAGAYGLAWQARVEHERAVADRRAALATLQPALAILQRIQGERNLLIPRLRAYDALTLGGALWCGILKDLSNLTPRAVTLNELAATPEGNLKIKGIVFANGTMAEMVLADYLGKLDSSPFFSGINLVGTREREDFDVRALDFEVTSRLPQP
jgi:type IV pilus assembly protein PilM